MSSEEDFDPLAQQQLIHLQLEKLKKMNKDCLPIQPNDQKRKMEVIVSEIVKKQTPEVYLQTQHYGRERIEKRKSRNNDQETSYSETRRNQQHSNNRSQEVQQSQNWENSDSHSGKAESQQSEHNVQNLERILDSVEDINQQPYSEMKQNTDYEKDYKKFPEIKLKEQIQFTLQEKLKIREKILQESNSKQFLIQLSYSNVSKIAIQSLFIKCYEEFYKIKQIKQYPELEGIIQLKEHQRKLPTNVDKQEWVLLSAKIASQKVQSEEKKNEQKSENQPIEIVKVGIKCTCGKKKQVILPKEAISSYHCDCGLSPTIQAKLIQK